MKNRYLLCLLICALLFYYAVPNLSVFAEGIEGIFALVWLAFALLVISGNLTALLYLPKTAKRGKRMIHRRPSRKKARSYND
ncbi:hypothetical protein PB1_16909 [Bacillus methanolicus PB1]|uniref:Uncharacterized protein n=1 Tax=Bacillus methanolicus PB1 TaxID=997296 RepID=I3DYD6_BACMT|nr:hypothetical protein [Bacillus methanolicus]EIJ79257.1 hypothetical protein PB1_16909 [Bacillus methanolicus PB1]